MNVSNISSIVSLVTGLVAMAGWLWSLHRWFRRQYIQTKEKAADSAALAERLILHATNPEKRADIYLLVLLQSVEFNARRCRSTTTSMGLGLAFLVMAVFAKLYSNLFVIDYLQPAVILLLITAVGFVSSGIMYLLSSQNLRRLEEAWETSAKEVIWNKVGKYVPEA